MRSTRKITLAYFVISLIENCTKFFVFSKLQMHQIYLESEISESKSLIRLFKIRVQKCSICILYDNLLIIFLSASKFLISYKIDLIWNLSILDSHLSLRTCRTLGFIQNNESKVKITWNIKIQIQDLFVWIRQICQPKA